MHRKSIAVLASLAMLGAAAPVAAADPGGAPNGGSSAVAKACAAQKKADKAAFKALWGKHAMRDCIRAGREDGVATVDEFRNASQECRAERDLDPAGFADLYGTNGNDRNAFGKCVAIKVHEEEVTSPV